MRRVLIGVGGVVVVAGLFLGFFLSRPRTTPEPEVRHTPERLTASTTPRMQVNQPVLPQPREAAPEPLVVAMPEHEVAAPHTTEGVEAPGERSDSSSEQKAHDAIAALRTTTDQAQLLGAIEAIAALPKERQAELVQTLQTRLQELQAEEARVGQQPELPEAGER